MATPKKNIAYNFTIMLTSASTPGKFVVDPPISAGDFQISIDNGVFADLATLPAVSPVGSRSVKIDLSTDEMNGAKITIVGSDPDNTWDDIEIFIDTPIANEDDYDITRKIIQNRQVVNAKTNKMEVFDDADTAIEFECPLFRDDGVTPWAGKGPIIRRNKLEKP